MALGASGGGNLPIASRKQKQPAVDGGNATKSLPQQKPKRSHR